VERLTTRAWKRRAEWPRGLSDAATSCATSPTCSSSCSRSSTLVARVTAGGAREPDGPEPSVTERHGIAVPGRTPDEPRD